MTFKELFIASLGYIFLYRAPLFKALLIPFLLIVCLDIFSLFLKSGFFNFFYFIASLMLQTLFAITTHRILLLGPDQVPEWAIKSGLEERPFFHYI